MGCIQVETTAAPGSGFMRRATSVHTDTREEYRVMAMFLLCVLFHVAPLSI